MFFIRRSRGGGLTEPGSRGAERRMGLLGGNMSIDLTVDGHAFEPGQTIACRVDVGGGPDDKLRELRVDLCYANTYLGKDVRDGRGDVSRTDTRPVVWNQVAASDPALAGAGGSFEFELPIPDWVPPSAPPWVVWDVAAILDRRNARDRRESVLVTILGNAGTYAEWSASRPVFSGDGCDMRLDVGSRVAHAGETLSGVLRVEPKLDLDVRGVDVALVGTMSHEDRIVRELTTVRFPLAGATAFARGSAHEYPFEITVPPDAVPSLLAEHNQMHWELRGICDRERRMDNEVAMQVVVYTAPG